MDGLNLATANRCHECLFDHARRTPRSPLVGRVKQAEKSIIMRSQASWMTPEARLISALNRD